MSRVPFESVNEQNIRTLRRDIPNSGGPTVIGYGDVDARIRGAIGDEVGLYVNIIGRASSDGVTGLKPVINGQHQRVATDLYGRLWFVPFPDPNAVNPVSTFHSEAVVNQQVISAAPATLYQARGLVDPSIDADRYLQIFDSAVGVNNGDIPVWEILIPAVDGGVEGADDFAAISGLVFSAGIVFALSSTAGQLTITGDEVIFCATYRVT